VLAVPAALGYGAGVRRQGWVLVAAAAGGAGWAVAELARPRRVDIRMFDPDEVARLETAMWRSYYDRRRLPLFGQLVALLQGQFHLQPLRAVALAGLAAELYQVPAERLWAHASRRAEAMTIRDRTSRRTVGVLDDDWDRIEAVLWVAWKALADEVRMVTLEEAAPEA
jgi:hypothetical protein